MAIIGLKREREREREKLPKMKMKFREPEPHKAAKTLCLTSPLQFSLASEYVHVLPTSVYVSKSILCKRRFFRPHKSCNRFTDRLHNCLTSKKRSLNSKGSYQREMAESL